jgi:hypothetical protein
MKFFSLILFTLFTFNLSASEFLPLANIVKIHGKAFFNKEVVTEGAEVVQGMEINIPKKGDYIIVKFQNGHKVRFSEATVIIEELTEKVTLLTLIKGQIHTFVNKLTKDEKFLVKTKYASFGVRGTKFGVSIDDEKNKAYLCVCEGVVNTTQNKMSVDVKKDEDIWVGLKIFHL